MIRYISVGIMFLINFCLYGQGSTKLLKIGDKMPDIEFFNMYNYPGGRARISDFEGKLLILDFWSLGCVPCIKAFPKMQELQDEFKDKVQVLLVNTIDNKEVLSKIGFPSKTKSTYINQVKLPFANEYNGISFDSLFEIGTLPYHVWIDSKGIIAATVSGTLTTKKQVKAFLEGKSTGLSMQTNLTDFGLIWGDDRNKYKSILQPGSKIVFHNMKYSSIITRNIGVKGFSGDIYDSISGRIIGKRISGDRLHLFASSFPGTYLIKNRDKVVLEVNNPEDYTPPSVYDYEKRANWEMENIYSYELILPSNVATSYSIIQEKMKVDLEYFFGVKASIERRKVKCRILIRTTKEDRLKTKGGEQRMTEEKDGGGLTLVNYWFSTFKNKIAGSLNTQVIKPFINETGFPDNKMIDIFIPVPLRDEEAIRKELNKYGMDIIEESREIEVLLIKNVN